MELNEIIKQAYTNHTIDYISYAQKEELARMYEKNFGEELDILCPRCIFSACVKLYKLQTDGNKQGKNRRGNPAKSK